MADAKTIEAIKKALESAPERKFPESVEVAVNLKDVDLSVAKNRLDEEVVLPKGRGKPIKVCMFASGQLAFKAKEAADLVITPEQIEDLAGDKRKARKLAEEYDFFIAEAPLMPIIGKRLGQVLGPRGRMPRPIPPTADPAPMIRSMRNTVRVRTKNQRTFHAPIGIRTMPLEDLAENLDFLLNRVSSKLERGKFNIQSAFVKTSMGPAVRWL
ncbi:MAG TPA: 50S ribosomal protein L1 [Thermoplasmata archaeon]|jgi:large subunit ribosomal protein L1|nr:50S ribosomal protein L1 [Thermoplasmata archaeon]